MDPVTIAKEDGGLVARPSFNALKECLKYVNEYDSNIEEVQDQYRSLKNLKDETNQKVELGERNNQTIVPAVREWMEGVDKFMDPKEEEWNDLLLEEEARKKAEQCCFGSCWSPKYRYNLSKKAVGQTSNINKKIEEMRERGTNPVALDTKPVKLTSDSSAFLKGLNSREKSLSDIMTKLKDDNVNRIGIHGMGGSGKTTLVQELARRCEGEKMFAAIVIAEISEVPDFKRIQDEIADIIGFSTLKRYHNIEERAMNLSTRLMRIRKRKRLYMNNEQHDVREAEKPEGVKSEGKYLSKEPTQHYLNGLTYEKEKKLILHDQKDQFEIIEEEVQLKTSKHVENDAIWGLEMGKSSNEDMKQEEVDKNGKLLIILDNMWQNIDLHLVGISYEIENDLGCKVIVTSRNEVVCKAMGVTNSCTFEVGDLDDDEAMQLFTEKVGEIAENEIYKKIIKKILKKCSHLPLSICLMANTLKNQPFSVWEYVLKQLENPIEEEILGIYGKTYSIIELSYKLLSSKEKKMFFLLCCIFPPGSTIHAIDLLRYGIGLDLFHHVDSIVEAIDQTCQWATNLKSLSLLSEVDVRKGVITIHDDVRKAGKSIATKGDFAFHVGVIPKWTKSYSYQNCKAISVMSNSYEHLDAQNLTELQLLRSLSMDSSKLSQNYFIGMASLKVLDMSDSIIENFPTSFGDLAKLEILILERCSLKNLSEIWKLVKLLVLSFKESNIRSLPEEMKSLIELKLLDLTNCCQLKEIPCGIFSQLKKLEGLYMKQSFSDWTTRSGSGACLEELACMSLKVIEIDIQRTSQLPNGDFPVLEVVNYKIGLAMATPPPPKQDQIVTSHDLKFEGVHACGLIKEGWKPLMEKVESLYIYKVEDLGNICPYLGEYWSYLSQIIVSECGGLQYLINPKVGFQSVAFPKLEYLRLEGLIHLEAIYNGKSPVGYFSSLQELILLGLNELSTCNIESGSATRLRVLEVKNCEKLVSIFSAPTAVQSRRSGETDISCEIRFPFLKILILSNLPALEGLFVHTNTDDPQQFLFPMQVTFPCLDKMKLERLGQIAQLWDMAKTGKEFITAFPELRSISLRFLNSIKYLWRMSGELHEASFSSGKLKKLKIAYCNSMEIVFPLLNAIEIHELEILRIYSCNKIEQVISSDGGSGEQFKQTMSFSKLQTLILWILPKLTYFFQGKVKIGFPALKTLKLQNLPKMKTLLPKVELAQKSKENQQTDEYKKKDDGILFNGEVEFPFLETLHVTNLNSIEGLWNSESQSFIGIFPRLQVLWIYSIINLKHVWNKVLIGETTFVSINLKELRVEQCDSLESLFAPLSPSSYTSNVELEFPELEIIILGSLNKFRYILQGNVKIKFPFVKKIDLQNMGEMVAFAMLEKSSTSSSEEIDKENNNDPSTSLFSTKVEFPLLETLYVNNLGSIVVLWDSKFQPFSRIFPNLQVLWIYSMRNLKHVWNEELIGATTHVSIHVKKIFIEGCDSLESWFAPLMASSSTNYAEVEFPELELIDMKSLSKLRYILQGNVKLKFPIVKRITLENMREMVSFSKQEKLTAPTGEEIEEDDGYLPVPLLNKEIFMPLLECLLLKQLPKVTKLWDMINNEEFSHAFPCLETLYVDDLPEVKYVWCDDLSEKIVEFGSLKSISIIKCDKMESLFSSGGRSYSTPQYQDQFQQVVSFSILETLFLSGLQSFRCLVLPQHSNIEFRALQLLDIGYLPLMKTLVRLEKNFSNESNNEEGYDTIRTNFPRIGEDNFNEDPVLFKGNVEFTYLETLQISGMFELESLTCAYEGGVENVNATEYSSIFPALRRLSLHGVDVIKMKRILETMLHKLKFLSIGNFKNLMYLVSSDDDMVSSGKALVKSLSELENLEELVIKECHSLKGIFQVDQHLEDNDVTLLHSSLKSLTLSRLPNLQFVQWHMLPSIQYLTIESCHATTGKETYLFPVTCVAKELWLQSLECITIISNRMESIIGGKVELKDDAYEIIFPQLKEVKLVKMRYLCMFSSTKGGTIRLPSLESIDFDHCGILTTFSSDPIEAPKLRSLKVDNKLLINTTCGDPNTALQSEFESEYKITKHWPRRLYNMLHNMHFLLLAVTRKGKSCDACEKEIMKFAYTCGGCEFDLHPECAMVKSQLKVIPDEITAGKDFPNTLRHESHEHEMRLVAGRDHFCDGCCQTGELFSYTCDICNFDLHPKCAIYGGFI